MGNVLIVESAKGGAARIKKFKNELKRQKRQITNVTYWEHPKFHPGYPNETVIEFIFE